MKHLEMGMISADHNGGTKSYHVAWISCRETGKSILMKRWGKTGQFGQVLIERFPTVSGAEIAGREILTDKGKKGYAQVSKKTEQSTVKGPRDFLGVGIFNAFGSDHLLYLDADIPVSGMPIGKAAARQDEDGNYIKAPPTKKVEIDLEEERRLKRERDAAELSGNPLYGLF